MSKIVPWEHIPGIKKYPTCYSRIFTSVLRFIKIRSAVIIYTFIYFWIHNISIEVYIWILTSPINRKIILRVFSLFARHYLNLFQIIDPLYVSFQLQSAYRSEGPTSWGSTAGLLAGVPWVQGLGSDHGPCRLLMCRYWITGSVRGGIGLMVRIVVLILCYSSSSS